MTKQMLEESIKENLVKTYKSGRFYAQYGYLETIGIMVAIAKTMGYEIHICHFPHGRTTYEFLNKKERQNIITIMEGMEKANLLKQSKNGNMYKLAFVF